jgi:hypothetical protein
LVADPDRPLYLWYGIKAPEAMTAPFQDGDDLTQEICLVLRMLTDNKEISLKWGRGSESDDLRQQRK